MLFYIFKEKGNLKKAYKMYKASKKIKQQDLFSDNFYLKKYPDVKDAKISPLNHYLYHGYKEGKQPGKLFDNNYYLKQNPDVKQSGENPLVHYVLYGKKEGRNPIKKTKSGDEKEIKRLKQKIEKYHQELKNSKKEINRTKRQIERLQKKSSNNFSILEAYNKLFNDLYIFHETTPKGPLKDMQDLCLELFVFFDKICTKYNIDYWLDYGTLLGPVRHGGFLPWDDDIDIGMLKKDFDKLTICLNKEIKAYDLEKWIIIREKKKYDNTVTGFIQVICKGPLEREYMLGCLDILPYEYLKNENNLEKEDLKNKISDQIEVTKPEFEEKGYFKKSPIEANEKLNEIIGIVPHEAEYIIPAAINLRPNRIRIYKKEEMFPLQRIKFEEHEFLAAKEEKEYLKMTYGKDFMSMPKKIKIHNRIPALLNDYDGDLHELFDKSLEILKKVNEKFN